MRLFSLYLNVVEEFLHNQNIKSGNMSENATLHIENQQEPILGPKVVKLLHLHHIKIPDSMGENERLRIVVQKLHQKHRVLFMGQLTQRRR